MKTVSQAIADLADEFERARVPFIVGGSIASSIWGEPRQTNDVDIEVWLDHEGAARLLGTLTQRYFLDESDLARAIEDNGPFPSFQILDGEAGLRFDCFVVGNAPFDEEAHAMAREIEITTGRTVRVARAEHIFVQKLRWYELGRRVSERQLRDLRGIVQIADLDWDLIQRWSEAVGVLDLARAFQESAPF